MGGKFRRVGHGCTYGYFLLMYDQKPPQNTVKQLSFNWKERKKKKNKNLLL